MKVRTGFVSNSSSASFVIEDFTYHITVEQTYALLNCHDKINDCWEVNVRTGERPELRGHTFMDNGDMSQFMNKIKIPKECVEWDED